MHARDEQRDRPQPDPADGRGGSRARRPSPPPPFPSPPDPAFVPACPPPLRLGVVGTGYIANVVGTALRETTRVHRAGVASRDVARARQFALTHADPQADEARAVGDWRELVAWDGIDAVYLALPTVARTEVAIEAARHGKHLLVEKPFTDVAAIDAIAEACRAHGVAFLDATHFVHHPRHQLLRRTLHERIGELRAVHACFTFPSMDRGNIRHDPSLEPTGAWGDMGWYAMRALVECTGDDDTLAHGHAVARRDEASGAVVRSDGVLQLAGGVTATWTVAFDIGTCLMDLHLMGSTGRVRLDDFVLDWGGGFAIPLRDHAAEIVQQNGVVNPSGIQVERVASGMRQIVRMLERLAELATDGTAAEREASVRATRRTQQLLDDGWRLHRGR